MSSICFCFHFIFFKFIYLFIFLLSLSLLTVPWLYKFSCGHTQVVHKWLFQWGEAVSAGQTQAILHCSPWCSVWLQGLLLGALGLEKCLTVITYSIMNAAVRSGVDSFSIKWRSSFILHSQQNPKYWSYIYIFYIYNMIITCCSLHIIFL